jgi:AcrR family transcriptional regulator
MPGQKAAEADRQEQILAAAMDVATRHGLEGLTIRRVASEAGLSHGLVRFRFKSKAELLATLLDRLFTTRLVVLLPDTHSGVERTYEKAGIRVVITMTAAVQALMSAANR